MTGTIWVFDDDEWYKTDYANRLQEVRVLHKEKYDVVPLSYKHFHEQMVILNNRRRRTRGRKGWGDKSSDVDSVDIFVVDYDLLSTEPFLTGENVAYLARCFSRCGLIIGLNQFGKNPFDLTLRGHPDSFADLNIGSDQLSNPGLWGETWSDFRPWHWPIIPEYLKTLRKRLRDVAEFSESPICDVLDMRSAFTVLPKRVAQFLVRNTRLSPAKVTFKEFVTSSGNGLRAKDKIATAEMISSIGAARVAKWLERLVLPSQEILIDAPHLVLRYPSLLVDKGKSSNVQKWNKTAGIGDYRELPLDHRRINRFRFRKDYWLSRPTWFWESISTSQTIREVNEPWSREATSNVFCEDTSHFAPQSQSAEFVADVDSPYMTRYVLRPDKDVRYSPEDRFLQGR